LPQLIERTKQLCTERFARRKASGRFHRVAADRQIDERVGSAVDQAASARGLAVRPEAIGVAPRAAPFDWC